MKSELFFTNSDSKPRIPITLLISWSTAVTRNAGHAARSIGFTSMSIFILDKTVVITSQMNLCKLRGLRGWDST